MTHSPEVDKLAAMLAAPFPPDRISWRVGSTTQDKKRGMALAFIDARDVMQRLDEVCGVAGWQCRYPHANGKTVCEIGVLVTRGVQHGNDFWDGWVWKADGAGDTDFEAEKGALSDAFKRAAVRFGIGRYLYDLDAPWVALDQSGKRIAESELPKLRALLSAARGNGNGGPSLPPGATATVRQPGPRAPFADYTPKQWQRWAEGRVELPPRELSDWLASELYNSDMAACKSASAKLHDWVVSEIEKRNTA